MRIRADSTSAWPSFMRSYMWALGIIYRVMPSLTAVDAVHGFPPSLRGSKRLVIRPRGSRVYRHHHRLLHGTRVHRFPGEPTLRRKVEGSGWIPSPGTAAPKRHCGGHPLTVSPVELQGHPPITSRIGLFVFAWTGVPTHIPWIAPLLSTVPYGAGTVLLFLGISVRPLAVGCLSGIHSNYAELPRRYVSHVRRLGPGCRYRVPINLWCR